MNKTRQLYDLGQSLWLDNITRGLLDSARPRNYIDVLDHRLTRTHHFDDTIANENAY